jgi:hypothetical protein
MDFKNYHYQFLYKISIPTYKEIREQMAMQSMNKGSTDLFSYWKRRNKRISPMATMTNKNPNKRV